jgi:hypothetical protein
MDLVLKKYLDSNTTNPAETKNEFEIQFKHNAPLTKINYNNVIEWLLMAGFKIINTESLLRISDEKGVRAEINGIEAIKQFCKSNELLNASYTNKQRIINDNNKAYNVQFSLNTETKLDAYEFAKTPKTYRYMIRVKLQHPDHPFVVDCSIVKMKRNEINPSMIFKGLNSYEVEVEFINHPYKLEELKSEIKFAITSVLRGLQRSKYPISYLTMKKVVDEYNALLQNPSFQFIGPQSVTLHQEHLSLLTANKGENFVVTDKADGERKILFVSKDSYIYYITTNGNVESTNVKVSSSALLSTIIDGEHVVYDKDRARTDTFYAFDLYFVSEKFAKDQFSEKDKGKLNDVRPFMFDDRYNYLKFIIEALNKPQFKYKQFRRFTYKNCADLLSDDIDYVYHIDGLIFTPTNYGVGLSSTVQKVSNQKKTWELSFKWKPAHENTIDFHVKIKDTKQTLDGKQYQQLFLYSNFNNEYLACPSVTVYKKLQDQHHGSGSKLIEFIGGQPYDVNAHLCNILSNPLNEVCTELGEIIESDMIIECKYVAGNPIGWRWIPIRVRWDKQTPNAYKIAVNNWISIHNPVTQKMITGEQENPSPIIYYIEKKKDHLKHLRDFHNTIKKELIQCVSIKPQSTLIDFAVGKGGDINKWILLDGAKQPKYRFILGIDYNADNLHNNKKQTLGAFGRYIQLKQDSHRHVIPEMLFLEGDSSKSIRYGDAIPNYYEQQIMRYLFNQNVTEDRVLDGSIKQGLCKNGFDVGSIQFAMHYMFKTRETILGFVHNLMDCIKLNGHVIITCFDGEKVIKLLKDVAFNADYEIPNVTTIKKKYNIDKLTRQNCEGVTISIKQDTLNNEFMDEYLVYEPYFVELMAQHGFTLDVQLPFTEATDTFDHLDGKILTASNMPEGESILSHLNRYYIFKKTSTEMKVVKQDKIEIRT